MRNILIVATMLLAAGCADPDAAAPSAQAQSCIVTQYTNGKRVQCAGFDALEFGAIDGATEERPCSSQPTIYFLRLDAGTVVDVRSGTIVVKAPGSYTEGACEFTL